MLSNAPRSLAGVGALLTMLRIFAALQRRRDPFVLHQALTFCRKTGTFEMNLVRLHRRYFGASAHSGGGPCKTFDLNQLLCE